MVNAESQSRYAKRKKSETYRWGEFQRQAKRRRLTIAITESHHARLTACPCSYCGTVSTAPIGVDRFINEEGYTNANSVPCCKRCNFMKAEMDIFDFLHHVMLIALWVGRLNVSRC